MTTASSTQSKTPSFWSLLFGLAIDATYIEAAKDARRLFFLVGGEAGLRSSEMRALQWVDVNRVKRQLCVQRDWRGQVSMTKGNRLRYVLMTQRLTEALG